MNLKLHFLTGVSLLLLALGSTRVGIVTAHEESGEWHCDSDEESRIVAEFRPGLVTLDGHADDWADIDGFEFPLLPALDPDTDHQFGGGKMTVKALHDGKDVYFMLQVDGDYAYTKGDDYKCPSVALMYQVGESATYHNMGGCKESRDSCNAKSCRGYEVDIMHFSIGNAIPGRLYGGNPIDNRDGNGDDRFGHLVDLYAWNPHCLNLDGVSRTGNFWYPKCFGSLVPLQLKQNLEFEVSRPLGGVWFKLFKTTKVIFAWLYNIPMFGSSYLIFPREYNFTST